MKKKKKRKISVHVLNIHTFLFTLFFYTHISLFSCVKYIVSCTCWLCYCMFTMKIPHCKLIKIYSYIELRWKLHWIFVEVWGAISQQQQRCCVVSFSLNIFIFHSFCAFKGTHTNHYHHKKKDAEFKKKRETLFFAWLMGNCRWMTSPFFISHFSSSMLLSFHQLNKQNHWIIFVFCTSH